MTESNQMKELSVLLFELQQGKLLLPDIAIAEIIDYQASKEHGEQAWYLGQMQWRNTLLPVVFLEGMNSEQLIFENQARMKAIVVHSLAPDAQLKYWAFVTPQAPKLQKVDAESLVIDSDAEAGAIQKVSTELYGEPVLMIDIEQVEKLIRQQLTE